MNYNDEEIQALVIQIGNSITRAGFAGDYSPRSVFPTVIGQAKNEQGMENKIRKVYIGDEAMSKRNELELSYPIMRGVVVSFEHLESVFHHVFYSELRVDPVEHPIMISEPLLNPKANREHIVQLMFETFNIPAIAVENSAKLTFFAQGYGRTVGFIVQMGTCFSYTLPVFEGYLIYFAAERINLGGIHVTNYLKGMLEEKRPALSSLEVYEDIKEKLCFVALDYEQALVDSLFSSSYVLPDGKILTLGSECFRAAEVIFKPFLCGAKAKGLHELVFSSLNKCPIDTRSDLSCNIIISGGNSMFEGLKERLEYETKRLEENKYKNVRVIAMPERKYSVWEGGSTLASYSFYKNSWFSKQSYDKLGPEGIHKYSDFKYFT